MNGKGLLRVDIISKFWSWSFIPCQQIQNLMGSVSEPNTGSIMSLRFLLTLFSIETQTPCLALMKKSTLMKLGTRLPWTRWWGRLADRHICTDETAANIAVDIFESNGPFYDLYNWKQVPLPCNQIHVVPRKTFESPEWDNQTWINAKFMKISKITEQQESYSFTSFYAEVGGFVGLLLGISVHQVSLLLDYIPMF